MDKNNFEWLKLILNLPVPLLFIIIVDWRLMTPLVDLYQFQSENLDEFKLYTFIAIGVIVAVNLIIIIAFAGLYFYSVKTTNSLNNPIDPSS